MKSMFLSVQKFIKIHFFTMEPLEFVSLTKKDWETFFAWLPVRIVEKNKKKWIWLKTIYRQPQLLIRRRKTYFYDPYVEEWIYEYRNSLD